MTALRLGAVVAFVEAQERLGIADVVFDAALHDRRDAQSAFRGAWEALTAEEQHAVNGAYEPGGVEVTA